MTTRRCFVPGFVRRRFLLVGPSVPGSFFWPPTACRIASVRTYDRVDTKIRTFAAADCGFSYRSAGSFFTNPLLTSAEAGGLPDDAPRYAQPDGTVKTSAAWLIEHAGFTKGYGTGAARLSTKHTLALTNRGEATTADLLALACEIRNGVEAKFASRLSTNLCWSAAVSRPSGRPVRRPPPR